MKKVVGKALLFCLFSLLICINKAYMGDFVVVAQETSVESDNLVTSEKEIDNENTYFDSDSPEDSTENISEDTETDNSPLSDTDVADDSVKEKKSLSNLQGDFSEQDIIEIKQMLTKLGFGGMTIDGNFDDVTKEKILAFQSYYGFSETGEVDSETYNAIEQNANSPFQKGERHENTIKLKEDLALLGFGVSSNPTTLYGSKTEQTVKEFQTAHNLVVNGIADDRTLELIEELVSKPLQKGMRREDVKTLKQNLETIGFKVPGNGTNLFGTQTEKKVKEFQEYYGLPVNGIVDQQNWDKINEILNSPFQNGKRHEDTIKLKEDLALLGFGVSSNPTTLYGSKTEQVVRDFQNYYGLVTNGIADPITLEKIESMLNSPFRNGEKHEATIKLKMDLNTIGFYVSSNPTDLYGTKTEQVVKEFQVYYGLIVNGIADDATLAKIDSILNSPFRNGKKDSRTIQLKKDLEKIGFKVSSNPTNLYGSKTEQVVKEFQRTYGLVVNGIADDVTLAKIEELLKGINYTKYNISLEDALKIQMSVNPQTDKKYAWVSKSHIKNSTVTVNALNVRKGPGTSYDTLGTISKGTKVDIVEEYKGWYAIKFNHGEWVSATPSDVRYYLDPKNFINDPRQRFQFLDLSRPSGAPVSLLDKYLKGKGVLKDQGQAFIDGGRLHGVNDIYLISHAILETGNGTSDLAKGQRVGLNKKGKPVLVTKSNEKQLTKIKTVHNVFGIGAYDSCPKECGAIKAYEEGWDSVAKAITGGAAFIGNDYIKAGQNTLYKMRWNPEAMARSGEPTHQYATDIGWASKQLTNMYNLYQEIDFDSPVLDIPVYK